jgi:hypothetical protein
VQVEQLKAALAMKEQEHLTTIRKMKSDQNHLLARIHELETVLRH